MTKYLKLLLILLMQIFVTGLVLAQSHGVGALEYVNTFMTANGASLRTIIEDNHLFVATESNGLFAFDISDFTDPKEITHIADGSLFTGGIQKKGDIIYVSDKLNGIIGFEFTNNEFKQVFELKTSAEVWDVLVLGDVLYSAESKNGLVIYNIKKDGSLSKDSDFSKAIKWGWAWRLRTFGDSLYVIDKDAGVKIFKVTKPADPEYVTSFTTNGTPKDILVDGGQIYVANGPSGLSEFSLSTNGRVKDLGKIELQKAGDIQTIIKSGNFLFAAGGNSGVYILSKSNKGIVKSEFVTQEPGEAIGVSKRNIQIFISSGSGLKIYKYNAPPVLKLLADQTVNENQPLKFVREGKDPEGANVIISAENLPEGSDYNVETHTFNWTPNFEQSGDYRIFFTITEETDLALFDSDTIDITVIHVNRKPVMPAIAAQTIDEAKLLSVNITAGSDPDREDFGKLRHFARHLPEGATFDSLTLKFSWTPTYRQSGNYIVDFGIVDPSGLEDVKSMAITVNHVNLAPEIAEIKNQTIDENTTLNMKLAWSDFDIEDAGKLTVDIINLPSGAVFDKTSGDLKWVPTYEQSGNYDVTLKITDSNSDGKGALSAEKTFKITVNHVSRTPIIAALKDITINEDQLLTTTIRNYDLDVEDFGKLKLVCSNLPVGAQLNDSTLTWTPDYFQSGDYVLNFTVTEPSGLNSSQSLKIKVMNVNRNPIIADFANPFTGNENDSLSIKYSIADPDKEELKITIDKVPVGAKFDESTQTLTWTPTYEQSGKYDYTITAVDPLLGKTSKQQTIIVVNVNRAPIFSDLSDDQTGMETVAFTFKLTASDPDKQAVTVTTSELPVGSKYDAKTGIFTWKPTNDQAGIYPITFKATDTEQKTTEKTVTLTIKNFNRPPVFAKVASQKGKENVNLTFSVAATDPDGQKLVYSTTDAPTGLSIEAETGVVKWTPSLEQAGKYTVTFVATDPEDAKVETKVPIEIVNAAFAKISAQKVKENSLLTFTVSAMEQGGEKLSYSSTDAPAGLTVDAESGTVNWTPNFDQAGKYTVTFIATDSKNAKTDVKVAIEVTNTNRAPELSGLSDQTVTLDDQIDLTAVGTDADNQKLTYSITGTLPKGAKFDSKTATFSWKPTGKQTGSFGPFSVIVKDSDGASAKSEFKITVNAKPAETPQQK